jgi:hypothetical protein
MSSFVDNIVNTLDKVANARDIDILAYYFPKVYPGKISRPRAKNTTRSKHCALFKTPCCLCSKSSENIDSAARTAKTRPSFSLRFSLDCVSSSEPVFLNVYGAPELIPRNEFRQPM